jgi:hypothetical protein
MTALQLKAQCHQRRDPLLAGAAFDAERDARAGSVGEFLVHQCVESARPIRKRVAAALFGAVPAAALGGIATVAIALLWMKLFPALPKVDRLE